MPWSIKYQAWNNAGRIEKTGKPKATYKLEEMNEVEKRIMIALGIENAHNEQPKIKNVGVYK